MKVKMGSNIKPRSPKFPSSKPKNSLNYSAKDKEKMGFSSFPLTCNLLLSCNQYKIEHLFYLSAVQSSMCLTYMNRKSPTHSKIMLNSLFTNKRIGSEHF